MPHVDEGTLHAYLDGALDALLEAGALPHGVTRESIDAHLAVCADCRALLDAERTIRTRAGAVLEAAAPVIDMPPFGELFALSPPQPKRRAWPMAWAASVVLAVGAGWWGSEVFRNQNRMVSMLESAPSAAPAAPDATLESQRAMTDADARAGGAGMAPPVPAQAGPAEVERASTGSSLQDAAANAGERRERARAADETNARGLAAAPQAPETEAARLARSEDTRRAAAADTGRAGGAVLGRTLATPAGETAAARPDRALAAAAPSAPPPPAAVQQRAARSDFREATPSVPTATVDIEQFRQSLTELDAGRIPLSAAAPPAELPLLQIDGGSPPTVQRGALLGASLARITQRAPSGVEVELIVWQKAAVELDAIVVTGSAANDTAAQRAQRQRAAAERAQREGAGAQRAEKLSEQAARPITHTVVAGRPLPDGRRELLLRSDGYEVFIALRAPVSAAELQALAALLIRLERD